MTEHNYTHDSNNDDNGGVYTVDTQGLDDAENGAVSGLIFALEIVQEVTKSAQEGLDESSLPFMPGEVVLQYFALLEETYSRQIAKLCGLELPDGSVGLLSAEEFKTERGGNGADK